MSIAAAPADKFYIFNDISIQFYVDQAGTDPVCIYSISMMPPLSKSKEIITENIAVLKGILLE